MRHFIKSRGGLFVNGLRQRTSDLIKSYSIDKLEFQECDFIIHIGANIEYLIPYFSKQRYIGFEPSPAEFAAIEKNTNSSCKVFNFAVCDIENKKEFFIFSTGADS